MVSISDFQSECKGSNPLSRLKDTNSDNYIRGTLCCRFDSCHSEISECSSIGRAKVYVNGVLFLI
jgi:hypothetical protein